MDFLLFLFCLNLFIHLFDKYVKTFLVNQGFRVYARFSGSPEFKSYNDLRLQLLSTKRDLNNVSAQDEFAKWARLNRKFDQLNVKWEKQSKIVSQKSEGVKKLISLTFWIVTRGYRFIVQFKNSGNPVFAVPEGMLPTWALWFLALPKAKTGYVSVAVWNFASQKAYIKRLYCLYPSFTTQWHPYTLMTSKVTLPIVMLASGVANTVLSKYQDLLAEENGPVKSVAIFQSLNIFMGEACLWFYVIWNRWKNRFGYAPVKPLTTGQKMSMAIPAFMDICGSTLMNVGLLFTSASVYQMTRGSLIIFVALFSMLFLQKRLTLQRWLCLAFVVLGVAIVGYSGSSVNAGVDPTLGLVAILVGQMFLATQFTVEEYLLSSIDIEPNEVVAYEGTFGVIFVLIIMVVSYIFVGRTPEGKNGWFDFTHVFHRFNEEPMLYVISGVILISIAFFNASGLAITKLFSATTRSLLDIARTFGIWIIALIMGMESFHLLQLIGFTILIYGILTYHDILPFLNVRKKESVV